MKHSFLFKFVTIPVPYGKGKAKALNVAKKEETYIQAFGRLGHDFYFSEETKSHLLQYTCDLYGGKGEFPDVNILRYQIFKGGNLEKNSCHQI